MFSNSAGSSFDFTLIPQAILVFMAQLFDRWIAENEFLRRWKKIGQANRFYRTMANRRSTEELRACTERSSDRSGGAPRQRTGYLAVSFANECAYCSAAHMLREKGGITDDEMTALRTEQDSPFTLRAPAIQYARELTAPRRGTPRRAREHFSSEQIVEITLMRDGELHNRFNNGLQLNRKNDPGGDSSCRRGLRAGRPLERVLIAKGAGVRACRDHRIGAARLDPLRFERAGARPAAGAPRTRDGRAGAAQSIGRSTIFLPTCCLSRWSGRSAQPGRDHSHGARSRRRRSGHPGARAAG